MTKDITEKRNTEELLLKSEKLTAVGELAAGVAHEIRNPLTALKGFTQLLQAKTNQEDKLYFAIMQNELSRIDAILGELLILAKPQAVEFKPQDLCAILSEVVTLLSTQAILNDVEISTSIADRPIIIECEENQLKQVFVNLIKNAIEAMPGGGNLAIQVTANHKICQLTFTDNGTGIPEEKLARLGEPFYTTKDKGTGLGLMVTHKIVSAHNGKISYQSRVGEGTTVLIEFPVVPSEYLLQ